MMGSWELQLQTLAESSGGMEKWLNWQDLVHHAQ
jgi:hypothetical protein